MQWYYAAGNKQAGPVDDSEFQRLRRAGTITPDTLVWHEGMPDWRPLRQVPEAPPEPADPALIEAAPGASASASASGGACSECGRMFAADQLLDYEGRRICAACKPLFFQRLKEGGGDSAGARVYGGFWIRVAAKIIDHFILQMVGMLAGVIVALLFGLAMSGGGNEEALGAALMVVMYIFGFGLALWYNVWFVGRFGATPGKMACGLRVITANGEPVTYGRAVGRFFAEFLSSCFTLNIGYIIAAFDDEKQTLHDRICDTRVIRKGG